MSLFSGGSGKTMSNRRRSERYAVTLPVAIQWPDGSEATLTANVSAHGIAVFTRRQVEPKSYVSLQITVPPDRQIVSVTAMVARSTPRVEDRAGGFHPGIAFDLYLFEGHGRAVWRAFIERLRAGVEQEARSSPAPAPLSSAPPPPGGTPEPEPAATFSIKPRDVARLWVFLRAELMRGKARIETPVLKPVGSAVELLVIHPETNHEWILRGKVTVASEVGRGRGPMLEIGFLPLDEEERARFRDFVETGQVRPPPPAAGPPRTSQGPDGQPTLVGVKAAAEPLPALPPAEVATDEAAALPGDESTDERLELPPSSLPAGGAIPSEGLARPEGTFASFFAEFSGSSEARDDNPQSRARRGPPELSAERGAAGKPAGVEPASGPAEPPRASPPPAPAEFDEEVTSPEQAALRARRAGAPPSAPAPAPRAEPRPANPPRVEGPMRPTSVAPTGAREPPPAPVQRLISTESSDPALDRELAIARARVVRTPDSATAVYQLGRLLIRRGGEPSLKEALKVLERCVQIEPNHPGAHYSAAEAFAARAMYDAAEEHLRRARRLGYRIDAELERKILSGLRSGGSS